MGKKTHGMSKTPEYNSWCAMRRRCKDKTNTNYGARGISVCERWQSFEAFYADMGPRPSPKHTIDRLDNEKDYSSDNCRWATPIEQGRTRRTNVYLENEQEKHHIAEWARRLDMKAVTLYHRLYKGWDEIKALQPRKQRERPVEKVRTQPARQKIIIEYNGESHDLCEWENLTGINKATLKYRYQQGLSPEQIFAPLNDTRVMITWNGETKTRQEWAHITGINEHTIRKRLDTYGWSVERALSERAYRGKNQTFKPG